MPVIGARTRLGLERGDWDGALSDAESVLTHAGVTGPSAMQALVLAGDLGISPYAMLASHSRTLQRTASSLSA
jgi:hypothetical protein